MGTWGIGPFDNDAAADFAAGLDEAGPERRVAMIRDVLVRTIDATGWLADADEAVAAAALVAARCPGGEPVDPDDAQQWQASLARLRAVLVPPPPTIPLFDVERPA
ncbi:DUF4259 domain-containing protein [Streptomyces albogriseolus]|uniref:DUF4259 domain-containing protein n=1 Tax=Streptomyces albogriseolus TaxID=1887 RepID=UPI003460B4B0